MKSVKCLLISIFMLQVGKIAMDYLEIQYNGFLDGMSVFLIIFGIIIGILGCFMPLHNDTETEQ